MTDTLRVIGMPDGMSRVTPCVCCGKLITEEMQQQKHEWHRQVMPNHCDDCCLARCDAFPGECPNDWRDGKGIVGGWFGVHED